MNPESLSERIIRLQLEDQDPVTTLLLEAKAEARATRELLEKLGKNGGGWSKIIAQVTTALLVMVIVWAVTLERRISVLENNQFTDEDARAMEARILSGIPPRWFQDMVATQGLTISELDKRVRALETMRR